MEYSRFLGRTLGQYTLEAPLGKGGMASVYRAHQASVDRYVAIKVMTPEIANDPGFVERFQREARIIGRLEHPHILPVIDFGESEGTYYIVMRYMDGGSLDDLIRQRRLRPEEVAHYLDQIASALDYAHQKGVIHRDLKPNNVLLDRANNCYLTDFGIARIEGGDQHKLTATGSVMGTPAYMSPEQAMGRPVDGRSDIYTLGVMLYEMATGKLPFMADTSAALIFHHVYETPPSPRQINPSLPEAVEPVFMRVLAKAPDMRYGTAEALARDFSQALGIRSTPSKAVPSVGAASGMDTTFVDGASSAPPPTIPQKPDFTNPQALSVGRGGTVAVGSPLGEGDIQTPAAIKRGTPAALIAILAVVILGLVGGVFFLLNSQNESAAQTANTQTVIARQEATSTAVALAATSAQETQIALSATPTPSPTQTPTATPSETPTPNLTETFIIGRLATAEALETAQALQTQAAIEATETAEALIATSTAQAIAGATSTFIAGRLQTAEAVELGLTATINAQNTAIANVTATIEAADRLLTAEAEAIALTQTAIALRPTETPTPTSRFDPLASLTAESLRLTPTAIAVLPPDQQIPELLARDLRNAIDVLRAQGIIPESATLIEVPVLTEPPVMTGNEEEENVFVLEPFSRARFYDFFFSADVTIVTTEDARTSTSCGIYVAATNEIYGARQLLDADMGVFRFLRTQGYRLITRQNETWAGTAIESGTNAAIKGELNGSVNRISAVMVEGLLTIYVNGVLIVQSDDPLFAAGGSLGYFMIRGVKGAGQLCSFDNVQLWRLN